MQISVIELTYRPVDYLLDVKLNSLIDRLLSQNAHVETAKTDSPLTPPPNKKDEFDNILTNYIIAALLQCILYIWLIIFVKIANLFHVAVM